jgi:hypothetical protein
MDNAGGLVAGSTETNQMEWLTDSNGNKCSVEYFGSREAAQSALDSLKNCENCVNCYGCYGCSDCSGCSGCSGCSDCYDCYGCSGCYGCYGCSGCSDCYDCSDCSGCSDLKDHKPAPSAAPTTKRVIPVIPDIHKAIYAAASQPKALEMGAFHTCEKKHCRAGWAVTLAGQAGRELEEYFNTELAAMLIYRESGYPINPARFYDSNEDALADMERLARVAE